MSKPSLARTFGLLGCGLLVLVPLAGTVAACSSDDGPSTQNITDDLSILADQQGLKRTEIRCVADHLRSALSGDDLSRLGDDLDRFAKTSSLGSMSKPSQRALTDAITACAGG